MRIEYQVLWACVALMGLPVLAWVVAEVAEFLQETQDQSEWHP